MRVRLSVLLLMLAGCAPAAEGPTFPFELYVAAGLNDELSAFQVSLVRNGTSLDCQNAQRTCIKDQVAAADFVPLVGADGEPRPSLSLSLSLQGGALSTQDLTLTELTPGRNYALIIEALSRESPPKLAGSSCTYLPELKAGTNAPVIATISKLNPPAACDPRH